MPMFCHVAAHKPPVATIQSYQELNKTRCVHEQKKKEKETTQRRHLKKMLYDLDSNQSKLRGSAWGWDNVWKRRITPFKWNKNCFQFCPHSLKKVSIIPPGEKRKSSNLAKEWRARVKFEAPITSNYHFLLSTWWNDLMPFRGSSGLAQHRRLPPPCVSLWRWLIWSFCGDKRHGS